MVDAITAIGITALAIIIVVLIYWVFWIVLRDREQKRGLSPNRFELYFAENFRNLIDEWDIQTRPKVKTWKNGMVKRLNVVGNDIDRLKTFQRSMNTRLDSLTKEIVKLEKL